METAKDTNNSEGVYPQSFTNTPLEKPEVVSNKKDPTVILIIITIIVLVLVAGGIAFAFSQGVFSRLFSGQRGPRTPGGAIVQTADNTFVSPISISNDYIESYGFIYTVATTVRTIQSVENNNWEITTTITDPNFPKKLVVSGVTRILGLSDGQEKLVGKRALKEGMNVHMSLSYNIQNKRWFVTKLVIQDIPYNQLVIDNPPANGTD